MSSRRKAGFADFAVFGGCQAFPGLLHVGRPNVGGRGRLRERLDDILDTRVLTNNGPYVREFERRVADLVGVPYCIATCNATIALEIAARAVGMTGEVIVPSFTFVATASALLWQQITPVFCDIDPVTYNLDPAEVPRHITPRTSGIIGVHVWGRPCPTEPLQDIAREYGLKVLYDASHAFGCSHNGRMIGNYGDAEVFSFHATKFVNAFEGGAIVTHSREVAEKAQLMRNFGFVAYDRVEEVGTNGKMSEVSAAMGLTSLEALGQFITTNRANYHAYREGLAAVPAVRLIPFDERERCNYQYVVVEVHPDAPLTRDELVRVLHAEGVLARRYFYPGCHQMRPYRSHFPNTGLVLPVTERQSQQVLSLPTGTAVDHGTVADVCCLIADAFQHGREISRRLAAQPGPDVRRVA